MKTILEIIQDLFVLVAILFCAWIVYDTGAAEIRVAFEQVAGR